MITTNKQYWPITYLYWPIFYFQYIKKPTVAKPQSLMGYKPIDVSLDEKIILPHIKLKLKTNNLKIRLENSNDEILITSLLQKL